MTENYIETEYEKPEKQTQENITEIWTLILRWITGNLCGAWWFAVRALLNMKFSLYFPASRCHTVFKISLHCIYFPDGILLGSLVIMIMVRPYK